MKLGHWRSRPQQAEPTASQLVPALDRVREMREHSTWEPLTAASNIRERAERVSGIRQHVRIPKLADEREPGQGLELSPTIWLREAVTAPFIVIAGALVIVLVWVTLFAD